MFYSPAPHFKKRLLPSDGVPCSDTEDSFSGALSPSEPDEKLEKYTQKVVQSSTRF